jgi:hypothetical protein
METLLLIVVEICPVSEHAITQNLLERQELLRIVYLILIMPRKHAILLSETRLSNDIGPEISTEAIGCVGACDLPTTVTTMALLWSHIHIDETK